MEPQSSQLRRRRRLQRVERPLAADTPSRGRPRPVLPRDPRRVHLLGGDAPGRRRTRICGHNAARSALRELRAA